MLPRPRDWSVLADIVSYNPETGWFVWCGDHQRAGMRAGSISSSGHRREIHSKGVRYFEHTLAWAYMTGQWVTDRVVDHINGDPLDNRFANLRLATLTQNQGNRRRSRHSKSPYKGVRLERGTWVAMINESGRRTRIGRYRTAEEAAEAYHVAATAKWGEFAVTWRHERGRA